MTNRKKDIFDIFREQQQQLSSSPSPRAWRNLESRLDSHRRRNRLSTVRNLSMAAAVLLIAVVAVVITLAVNSEQNRRLNQSPIAAETLDTDQIAAAEELRLAVSAQHAEQRRLQPIAEGERHQKLIPSTLSGQPTAAYAPSLSTLSWLSGQWQSIGGKNGALVQWSNTGEGVISATRMEGNSPILASEIQIMEESGSLVLVVRLERGGMRTYELSYSSVSGLAFEDPTVHFPKRISLRRDGVNSFVLIYDNPQPNETQRPTLSNKPVQERFQRLRLQ